MLFGVGVLVTAIALYLALRDTDFAELVRVLRGANFSYVPVFLALVAVFYAMKAVRWRWLLEIEDESPGTGQLVGPMMIGFAANNLLPFRLGEIIRAVFGARRTGMSHTSMLASIVIERLLDVVALLLLGAMAVWSGPPGVSDHPVMRYAGPAALILAAVLLAAALASARLDDLLRRHVADSSSMLTQQLTAWVAAVRAGMQCIRDRRSFLRLVVWSVLHWIAILVTIRIACAAVGVTVDYPTATYLLVLLTLAVSVPSTPGFVGVIEYSFVLGLGTFGVDPDRALAAAVFYHVLNWISVTAVGTVFLHRASLTWREIGGTPDAVPTPPPDR